MATLRFDGKRVSAQWYAVLTAARHDGVDFRLNSGRRTLAEQAYLYNHQPPLAAFPNPRAPHIRTGRIDHAIDVQSSDGGAQRLAHWMRRHGLPANFTVRGEPWHIESTAKALRGFTKRDDPLRVLSRRHRKAAERLLFHRRVMRLEEKTGKGPRYKAHQRHAQSWKATVEAYMRDLRRDADRKGGWAKGNRGEKYQVLKRVLEDRNGRI